MYPVIFSIYGPFALNSFSVTLALGLCVFTWRTLNHPWRKQLINSQDYTNLVIESALAGIIGGRLLHILSQWKSYSSILQMLSIWNGGLSVLGAVAAVILYAFIYLKRRRIAFFPIADLATLYAPLIHAIARVGCFLAGCCYGKPTQMWWGVTYTNPETSAPLWVKIHPTQLYSALVFIAIFLVLRFIISKSHYKPGYVAMWYLILLGLERISIDFLRGDRIINISDSIITTKLLSLHQWLALLFLASGIIGLYSLRTSTSAPKPSL